MFVREHNSQLLSAGASLTKWLADRFANKRLSARIPFLASRASL